MPERRKRRFTECGRAQRIERRTVPYAESGLGNVQLQNVPVWVCDSAKEFAQRIGMEPVHVSRLETEARPLPRRSDLLIRLVIAAYLAVKHGWPFPGELVHLIDRLEEKSAVCSHRIRHTESGGREHEWEEAPV